MLGGKRLGSDQQTPCSCRSEGSNSVPDVDKVRRSCRGAVPGGKAWRSERVRQTGHQVVLDAADRHGAASFPLGPYGLACKVAQSHQDSKAEGRHNQSLNWD